MATERRFFAGTPSLLKALNERTVFDLVLHLGPISTAQLVKLSGMSKPTAGQSLSSLERRGLIRLAGRSSGTRGPAARLYEVNPMAGSVVGIDIGRSFVRAAVADLTGTALARRDERSKIRRYSTLVSQVGEIARGVAKDAGIQWRQVTFTVVGSPGIPDPAGDHMVLAHNLPGWGKPGLVQAMARELGPHLQLENDVNLAALGEQRLGVGKDVANFVFLQIGAGVGMGLVLGGGLFRGSTGAAGEVGYLPLGEADPRRSDSRRQGAFEASAAARGIVQAARAEGMTGPVDAKRVFASARRGDQRALRVIQREAERIALVLAAIVPVVDPELVVLGGAVGRNGDLLLEPIERELRAISPFAPRIEVSALGEDAVLEGAITVALDAARDRLLASAAATTQRQHIASILQTKERARA